MSYLGGEALGDQFSPDHAPYAWVRSIFNTTHATLHRQLGHCLIQAELAVMARFGGSWINDPEDCLCCDDSRKGIVSGISCILFTTGAKPDSSDAIACCVEALQSGKHPVLLTQAARLDRVRWYAKRAGIETSVSLLSIEDFLGLNTFLLAGRQHVEPIDAFRWVVEEMGRRKPDSSCSGRSDPS